MQHDYEHKPEDMRTGHGKQSHEKLVFNYIPSKRTKVVSDVDGDTGESDAVELILGFFHQNVFKVTVRKCLFIPLSSLSRYFYLNFPNYFQLTYYCTT